MNGWYEIIRMFYGKAGIRIANDVNDKWSNFYIGNMFFPFLECYVMICSKDMLRKQRHYDYI